MSPSASRLVRRLAPWAPGDVAAPDAVTDRLSAWLGPLDAITLQGQLHALAARTGTEARAPRPPDVAALAQDVQRVRGTLAQAIAQDPLALAGIRPGDPDAAGWAAWQQRHQELQRQMAQLVEALRDHVRQAAGRVSADLRELAALDAAFERLLALREQTLLPTAGALLERRFLALRAAHVQACESAGTPDDPAAWRRPGGWLATFDHDWREALLAELDLRLDPVLGLLEAVRAASGLPTP